MDWLTKQAVTSVARWWTKNRPFSEESREARQERKRIRQENRRRKKLGLPPIEEPDMEKFRNIFEGVGISALVVGVMTGVFGIDIAPTEVDVVVTGFATLLAVAGRIIAKWKGRKAAPQ